MGGGGEDRTPNKANQPKSPWLSPLCLRDLAAGGLLLGGAVLTMAWSLGQLGGVCRPFAGDRGGAPVHGLVCDCISAVWIEVWLGVSAREEVSNPKSSDFRSKIPIISHLRFPSSFSFQTVFCASERSDLLASVPLEVPI